MTAYPRRVIVVCPAAVAGPANAWVAANYPQAEGRPQITIPLTSDGVTPSHYWCSTRCSPQFFGAILEAVARMGGNAFDGETTSPEVVLAILGLKRLQPKGP